MRRLLGDLLQIWALLRSVPWPYCLECPALINVSMDNYILVIARKHPVFRYRMEVSVIGIKMQLAESSSHGTTFLFKGRGGGGGLLGEGQRGRGTHHRHPRPRSPHSHWPHCTSSYPRHTPCSCTATGPPGSGSGSSVLHRDHLHSPYGHHRVPKPRDTENVPDTGFSGQGMPWSSL